MIVVNLKGGLGNQMFQYACGRALSLRNNDQLSLVWSEYQGDTVRKFSLENFAIKGEIIEPDTVPKLPKLFSRLKQKLTRNFYVSFDSNILKKHGQTVYLDGYFQSEKYFQDFAAEIRQDFSLAEPLKGRVVEIADEIKNDANAVSLHVRRGDYLKHPDFGGIVTREYYERAIAHIRESVPNAKFYVFSDDIDWCRVTLPLGNNATFVSQPELKDYEEMILMSQAHHHIIANSSFSWWGAWLGNNPNKIVIAPNKWSNLHENWYSDIIPSTWIRL